ncbi:MAG TPA: hypothetical protein VHW93_10320, partial [Acidimicrobiales bacterium]|nr:hypothetical protein [Acidimicrobiales bacterium]
MSNSPMAPALIAGIAGVIFVTARLMVAAHGNVTMFIVAGSAHTTPAVVDRGIAVRAGSGYDGQFYYRMALDPLDMSRTAFGVRLDTISRLERVGYPVAAWLLAAGRSSLVPDSLIIVNLVALALLGYGGGLLAQEGGRHAVWGLT